MSEQCARCGYTRLVQTLTVHVAPLWGEREPTLHEFVPLQPPAETHSYRRRRDPATGRSYVASIKRQPAGVVTPGEQREGG